MRLILGACVLLLGAGACAVGVDTGDYGGTDAGGGTPDAAVDVGPSVESGPGAGDATFPEATADEASSNGDAAAVDSGGHADTGGSTDTGASTDTGVPLDTGVAEAGAGDTGSNDAGSTGCAATGFSGPLLTFDLSGQSGSEPSVAPTSSATGVTGGALARATALTATAGSGSINSSNWPTTASPDPNRYYTFTVTPAAGCTLTLTSLVVTVRASATGPTAGNVATSADGFAAHVGAFAGTATATVQFSGASGAGAIEVRIYGFGASSTAGTFRVESTLTLSGSIH